MAANPQSDVSLGSTSVAIWRRGIYGGKLVSQTGHGPHSSTLVCICAVLCIVCV